MAGIFLSYRRGPGASETAGRLNDRLASKYGQQSVFMDVDTVRPGTDFVSAIGQAMESSTVVLAVIDPQWAVDSKGRNRIAEASDYVRLEIGTALQRGVTVIPVLVLGAEMPPPDRLPPDLLPLASRQAVVLSHERFTTDILPLERELNDLLGTSEPAHPAEIDTPEQPARPTRSRDKKMVLGLVAVLLAAAVVAIVIAIPPSSGLVIDDSGREGDQVVVQLTNKSEGVATGVLRCEVADPSGEGTIDIPFVIPAGATEVFRQGISPEMVVRGCSLAE